MPTRAKTSEMMNTTAAGSRAAEISKMTSSNNDRSNPFIRNDDRSGSPSNEHLDQAFRVASVRGAYYARYSRSGALEDLDMAIQLYEECLDATPRHHPDWVSLLDSLRDGYYHRYSRTGSITDLKKAVQRFWESLNTTSSVLPDQASRLSQLRAKYSERCPEITECMDSQSDLATLLHVLGLEYHVRFLETRSLPARDLTYLDRALQLYQESLDNTPEHHPDLTSRLSNLGVGFYVKHLGTMDAMYLSRATELLQESLDRTSMDHADCALRLYKLGAVHEIRYQNTGSMEDIDMVIRSFKECLDRLPTDHPDRPSRLRDLGMGYYRRYQELGTTTDLERAIQLFQASLDATPTGHPDRASRIYDLGAGYNDRYNETRTGIDLDLAIELYEECLENTPTHQHDKASRIRSMGHAYRTRYLKTTSLTDLDKAFHLFQEFLEGTPENHSDRATRLNDLATVYNDKYQENGTRTDLDKAILLHQEALKHSMSPIPDRLIAGKILIHIHAGLEAWEEAHEAAHAAIHLAPSVVPRLLEVSHKQSLLSQDTGLASDATAVALNAAKSAFDAVQLLEIGRGVIAGLFYEMPADVARLLSAYPALGEQFMQLKDQLDVPTSPPIQVVQRHDVSQAPLYLEDKLEGVEVPQTSAERVHTGIQLDKLIVEIRKQSGFENFLLASTEDEIRAAARHGPIVAINVSEFRCDAILIEQHEIRSLCLPLLNPSGIQQMIEEASLDSPKILEWLWDVVASPILDALGYTQPPIANDSWPHVWWIPTGALSQFPLHAAGYHNRHSSETVLDRVMSSYSSSIKAIIYGRQRQLQPSTSGQALLVAMERTPGYGPLPFATKEIAMLRDLFKSMPVEPVEPGQHKEDVTSRLRDCSVFHFAGHGYTDKERPSDSHLIMKDIPLTVADLLEMNLQNHSPFLAYLSACGTGQIKDDKFIDESIHLISAFQMAGFRHVIGTLWEVNDEFCVDVARYTYEGIRDRGMTDESVCYGLHIATRALRQRWLLKSARSSYKGSSTELESSSARKEMDKGSTSGNFVRDLQLSRHVLPEEELKRGHWVPYVHFGV